MFSDHSSSGRSWSTVVSSGARPRGVRCAARVEPDVPRRRSQPALEVAHPTARDRRRHRRQGPDVIADEVGVGDAVDVEEHQVIADRRRGPGVAGGRQRQRPSPSTASGSRRTGGAIGTRGRAAMSTTTTSSAGEALAGEPGQRPRQVAVATGGDDRRRRRSSPRAPRRRGPRPGPPRAGRSTSSHRAGSTPAARSSTSPSSSGAGHASRATTSPAAARARGPHHLLVERPRPRRRRPGGHRPRPRRRPPPTRRW